MIIREGIKKNIDWTENGFIFCGEAGDGEIAFPMICKEKPDIVITDIKMPFMDGLELSRLIKKEMPDVEIIILSGYEEFEYAKTAISVGVAEYLLKPITGDELLSHIKELAGRITERRREKALFEQYRHEMEQGYSKERRDLFDELVTGTKSVSELMTQADRLGIDITAIVYNIMLLKVSSTRHEDTEFSQSVNYIEQCLDKMTEDGKIILFDRDPEGKALLFKADSEEELNELQNGFIYGINEEFSKFHHLKHFGGIGKPVSRLRELPESFESASRAFAHRYLMDESRIVSCDEIEKKTLEADFHISKVSPKQLDRTRIKDFLKYGDASETRFFCGEFFRGLGMETLGSTLFRQYLAMDAYFCVGEFLDELEQGHDELETIDANPESLKDAEGTISYVNRIIGQAIEIRDNIALNRYDSVIESVKDYICRNYSDEELAISSIAAYVNFSPNHLSMVFRQQTGQTLIKYLTDYRLNKAKEMLKCTSLRSSEISQKCGYKDPHYFSYLFKKTLGVTPTQYREGNN